MKTILKTTAFLCGIIIMSSVLTACSDDDDDNPSPQEEDNRESDYIMTAEEIADYAASNFISHVCEVEGDTLTGKLKSWKLNYGGVLDPATPTVRYVKFNSQEEALEKFQAMIVDEATIETGVGSTQTVNMGVHGSVTYQHSYADGEWARIEVNLKELPDLTELIFVKPEAWPDNGETMGVKKDKVFYKDGVYYVCVQEANGGVGYLIGFNTWTWDGTYPNHTYRGRNCYHPAWWNMTGGIEPIVALRGFLFNYDGSKYTPAENIIRNIGKNQGGNTNGIGGENALHDFLYSEGYFKDRTPFFKTGDDHFWQDEKKTIYGKWHWIRVPYTKMGKAYGQVEWTKICYECDYVDPNARSVSEIHARDAWTDKWGKGWCISQFGTHWVWKCGEWFSYQAPYIIRFTNVDAENIEKFKGIYGLQEVKF